MRACSQVMTLPFAVLRMNLVCETGTSSRDRFKIVIGGLIVDVLGAAPT
jgi:hypothetical protein